MALMRSIASSSLLLSYLGGQFLFLLGRAFRRNHRPPTNECKAGPDLRRLGCHSSVISRAAGCPHLSRTKPTGCPILRAFGFCEGWDSRIYLSRLIQPERAELLSPGA